MIGMIHFECAIDNSMLGYWLLAHYSEPKCKILCMAQIAAIWIFSKGEHAADGRKHSGNIKSESNWKESQP